MAENLPPLPEDAYAADSIPLEPPPPTQVRRPWRATVRTVFQGLVAFAAIAPAVEASVEAATGYDLEGVPYVATGLLAAAAVTKVMTNPAVEVFLEKYLPFLAATSKGDRQ